MAGGGTRTLAFSGWAGSQGWVPQCAVLRPQKVQAGIYFKMIKDYRFPTVQAIIWKRHIVRALRGHTLVPWCLLNMTSNGDKPLVLISISEQIKTKTKTNKKPFLSKSSQFYNLILS